MDVYEKLAYCTTKELWQIMSELGIPYATVEGEKKTNLETGEEVEVPKVIPRTDYDGMKSDIYVAVMELNRERRRYFVKQLDKTISGRIKQRQKEGDK